MNSKTSYRVQITSACQVEASLHIEANDKTEAVGVTHRFLSPDCFNPFDEALYVRHAPFVEAIENGQYVIGDVLEVDSGPIYPVVDLQRIEAIEINRSKPLYSTQMTSVDEYRSSLAKLHKAQTTVDKIAGNAFQEMVKALFSQNPKLNSCSWVQYEERDCGLVLDSEPEWIKINGLSEGFHNDREPEQQGRDDDGQPFDPAFHGALAEAVSKLLDEFPQRFFYRYFSGKNEEIIMRRDGNHQL
jgi:hypothetical protein